MLEPFPARDLHIGQPQPDPTVVVDQALPVYDPARQLSVITHTVKLQGRSTDVHGKGQTPVESRTVGCRTAPSDDRMVLHHRGDKQVLLSDPFSRFAQWLEFAWYRYYSNQSTHDLPDIIAHADASHGWPYFRDQLIGSIVSGAYTPDVVDVVDLPKDRLSVRPLARMSIQDQLVYEALVFSAVELIDSRISDAVFSYRWSKFKGDLRSPKGAWVRMQDQARLLQAKYPTHMLAKTDITSFYEHIEVDILLEDLQSAGVDQWTRDRLEAFLRAFQRLNAVWGIPQGSDASGILANLYLVPIDTVLRRRGLEYVRYSDDIAMFGETWASLRRELLQINRVLRGRHLSMSGAKTKILTAAEAIEEFDDGGKDAIRYGVSIGAPMAGAEVQKMFDTATATYPPNARDIRFALNQFTELDDNYAVSWILGNLAKVPHLAPESIKYLESFRSVLTPVDDSTILEMFASREFADYPYAEHHLLCFLLRRGVHHSKVHEAAWKILSDRNEETYLRETAARYIGLHAGPGDGALLKQEFRTERSDSLRRALLVALYESRQFYGLWLDDAAEAVPGLALTCHYLKTNPIIPLPPVRK